MVPPALPKILNILPPAAIVDDAAFTIAEVDTLGYSHARFIFAMGATDIAMAVPPKIQQSNTSGSGHADITGAAITAIAAGDDNKIYVIDVKIDNKKRYLQAAATGGNGSTGQYLAAICELHNPEVDLVTAAGAGVAEWIQV